MSKIDRGLSIPIYQQLYKILKNEIVDGKYKDGDKMRSENKIQEDFNVSRTTVRNVLEILENEGYIERSQGKESIIRNKEKEWWNFSDITNDLKTSQEKLTSRIVTVDKLEPSEKVRRILKLKETDNIVYFVERVRMIGMKKVAHTKSFINPMINLDVTQYDFVPETTISSILEDTGNKPFTCDETLEVAIADKRTSTLLEMESNSAVFFRTRINYNLYKQPLEYVESYYNSSYTKYYIKNKLV